MKKILAMVVAMVMVLGMVGCGRSEAPAQSTEENVTIIDNTKVEPEIENVTETEEKEYEIVVITQLCEGRAFWVNEEHTKNYKISEEDVEIYYGKTLEVTFTVYDWNDYTYEITKVIEQASLEGWGRNFSTLIIFRPRVLGPHARFLHELADQTIFRVKFCVEAKASPAPAARASRY